MIVTDNLKSYGAAKQEILPGVEHRQHLSEVVATFGQATRAEPEAVTPAFVFFACADSDYITGQVLAVDGGLTA